VLDYMTGSFLAHFLPWTFFAPDGEDSVTQPLVSFFFFFLPCAAESAVAKMGEWRAFPPSRVDFAVPMRRFAVFFSFFFHCPSPPPEGSEKRPWVYEGPLLFFPCDSHSFADLMGKIPDCVGGGVFFHAGEV